MFRLSDTQFTRARFSTSSENPLALFPPIISERVKTKTPLSSADLHAFIEDPYIPNSNLIDTLEDGNFLPQGVSASNVKYTLFLAGNTFIKSPMFRTKKDLKLNGCPGLPTPMFQSMSKRNISEIAYLIQKEVSERPLLELFLKIDNNYFDVFQSHDWNPSFCQGQLESSFKGFARQVPKDLNLRFKIVNLFLHNSTVELEQKIEQDIDNIHRNGIFFYFCWLAKNNDCTVFENEAFKKLAFKETELFLSCLKIAVLYNNKEFIINALNLGLSPDNQSKEIDLVLSYCLLTQKSQLHDILAQQFKPFLEANNNSDYDSFYEAKENQDDQVSEYIFNQQILKPKNNINLEQLKQKKRSIFAEITNKQRTPGTNSTSFTSNRL